MRPNFPTKRLAASAVIAAGAVSLLAGASSASAVVPGANGLIAMSKCEDLPLCSNGKHIWTIDPTTGSEQPVTSGASYRDFVPAFSPDGSRIAFKRCEAANGNNCRIGLVGVGGGGVTYPTDGTNYEDYPAFSPDGSKIVFSRDDPAPGGGTNLIVMDANGGNEHPLTSGSAYDSNPTWSPDGSGIVFQRQGAGSQRIYKVPAGGGSPGPLTAGPNDQNPNYSPAASGSLSSTRARPAQRRSRRWTPAAATSSR
jgi:Tol biopolymer transport system component